MNWRTTFVIVAAAQLCASAAVAVTRTTTVVNGVNVYLYSWTDHAGLERTVALKREGSGNPGHGGYAVQMTYRLPTGNHKLITAKSDANEGFGYFVSHERYRDFTDGDNDTIAHKIFHTDDSPLGLNFFVYDEPWPIHFSNQAAHRYELSYPRYGTVDPIPKDANGNDVAATPTDPSKFALYHLNVAILWYFEDRSDYPMIETQVTFGDVPGPDRVNFDVRGPYGVMRFDDDTDVNVDRVMWGDRYHFKTLGKPATRGSAWTWKERNSGARYTALTAGKYEMGLFEPRLFKRSMLRDGYADARGDRSSSYRNGRGCDGEDQLIPCDWEWPYQSLQYSLPNNRTDPSNYKKIAWGSSLYYGSGKSLSLIYDSPTTTEKFDGMPPKGIVYDVCLVLGRTVPGGLTRQAATGNQISCALKH